MKYIILILVLAANAGLNAKTLTKANPEEVKPALAVAEAPSVVPPAKVNFEDFKKLVAEVEPHRQSRLIDLNTFLAMSKEPDVIILDSRSAFRYQRLHVKGAKHLAYADYTQANLASLIPSPDTKILIYCNNNFKGNQIDFATKIVLPAPRPGTVLSDEFAQQKKPLMMALNIPTYINLYGYGYRNVYELSELVDVNDPRIEFAGSTVKQMQVSKPMLGQLKK